MLTTSWCGDCVRLKRQLTDLDIPYTEVNIEQAPDAERAARNKIEQRKNYKLKL